jgi:hypothetical protein
MLASSGARVAAQMAKIQESLDEGKSTIWKYYIRKET